MKNSTPDFNNSSPRGRLGGAVSLSERSGGAFKVLVIQQKMIGDVLTSSILFETLKEQYPSAELHYLIHKHTKPVVENNPFIDEFILFDPKKDSRFLNFISFLNYIRKADYDVVIDVYSKINSAFMSFASGAKIRVGQSKKYLDWAYTISPKLSSKISFDVPIAFYNRLEFLKPLGFSIDFNKSPRIYVLEEERLQLKEKLQKQNISTDQELIMINCLGSDNTKTYPLAYMAQFLDAFVKFYPTKKLLFNYIPKQLTEVEHIIKLCQEQTRDAILKFYAPNLREFIVLTSFCEAVVGNEGGAINIGKALNLKTFAVFSPLINKESWGHLNNEQHISVHLKDYAPELFEGKTKKEIKEEAFELYKAFSPRLFEEKLKNFL